MTEEIIKLIKDYCKKNQCDEEQKLQEFKDKEQNSINFLKGKGILESFEKLCDVYKLNYKLLYIFSNGLFIYADYGGLNNIIEEIDLIFFLKRCKGSNIKLSGTIMNPYQGKLKGFSDKITISDTRTLDIIESALINEIKNAARYMNNNIKEFSYLSIEKGHTINIDNLNENELLFMKYNYKYWEQIFCPNTFKQNVGLNADEYYKILESYDKFSTSGKVTNIYNFIYDYLVLLKVLPEIEDRREKYEYIRDAIFGYKKWEENLKHSD